MDNKLKYSMLFGIAAACAALPVKAYLFKPEKVLSEKKISLQDMVMRNLL